MNLYTVELPCSTVTAVINDLTVTDVHSSDGFHFPVRQRKIEDSKVFLHAVFMDSFGNGWHFSLVMPAKDYLGCCFIMFFCNFYQCIMMEYIPLCF